MNRVWRRFLSKISWLGVAAVYLLAAMAMPSYVFHLLGWDPNLGLAAGAFVFVLLPMIAFGLHEVYKDAKEEIERENRRLMNSLKGDGY